MFGLVPATSTSSSGLPSAEGGAREVYSRVVVETTLVSGQGPPRLIYDMYSPNIYYQVMESLRAGQRVRLDVVDGLGDLACLDEAVIQKYFKRLEVEILSPPDADGSLEFRHTVDMVGLNENGAWAPWTCIAQHFSELHTDTSKDDAWVMRTRMYAKRLRLCRDSDTA